MKKLFVIIDLFNSCVEFVKSLDSIFTAIPSFFNRLLELTYAGLAGLESMSNYLLLLNLLPMY